MAHECDSNVSWADENYRYTECSQCQRIQSKTPR